MKELKFRVWDKKNKCWIDNFYHDNLGNIIVILFDKTECLLNVEITQYTGLKDRNGNEIYEGDIVKVNPIMREYKKYENGFLKTETYSPAVYFKIGEIYTVVFDERIGGFSPFIYFDSDCDLYNYPEYFEIIGNIFDKI